MEKDIGEKAGVDVLQISIDLQSSTELTKRFESLAKSFEGFEDALISRKAIRSDDNERRFQKLLQEISAIEANVATESQTRIAAVKTMEDMFNSRLDDVRKGLEEPIAARFSQLSARLDSIAEGIKLVDDKVEADRVSFPKQIEQRSQALTLELKRFKERCQAENGTRQQHEKKLLLMMNDDRNTATERFRAQRFSMEQKLMALDQEIVSERRARQKDAESLLEETKTTLKELKESLEQCNKDRVRSIKEMSQAMTHYTAALQDGVTIVSQAAGL